MWNYDVLRELIRVLTPDTLLRSFQQRFLELSHSPRGERLLRGIASSSITSDREAMRIMGSKRPSINVFRAFKSRFVEEILNCYLTLDVPVTNDQLPHVRYRLVIIRESARIIAMQGHRLMALRLMHYGAKLASTYQISHELYTYSRLLSRQDLGLEVGLTSNADRSVTRSLYHRWSLEVEVEGLLQLVDINLYSNITEQSTTAQWLRSELDRIQHNHQQDLTTQATLHLYEIQLAYHAFEGCAESARAVFRAVCDELQIEAPHTDTRLNGIVIRLAYTLAQLRHFTEARELLEQHPPPTPDNTATWQMYYEVRIVAHLHEGDFASALHLWNTAHVLRSRTAVASQRDNAWHLIGGYLAILELLNVTGTTTRRQPFRLRSLLNSLPKPQHPDLRFGLPVLTLEIAYAIAHGDYDQAQRRIEYAAICVARVSGLDAYQPYIVFTKLLRLLLTNRFVAKQAAAKSKPHRQRLRELQHTMLPSLIAEIIPFETMFDLLLGALRRNAERQPD